MILSQIKVSKIYRIKEHAKLSIEFLTASLVLGEWLES